MRKVLKVLLAMMGQEVFLVQLAQWVQQVPLEKRVNRVLEV